MAEGPRLAVVSGEADPDEPSAARPAPARRGPAGRWIRILGGLLLLCVLALGLQTRRAARLSGEVGELDAEVGRLVGELSETQTALEAHRHHLDEVRAAVDRLQELLVREPEPQGKPL